MKQLDLQSEMYPPTGGLSAEGARNQLGRPRLDRIEVLIREAVQNSWDARTVLPVHFALSAWTMDAQQHEFLRRELLVGDPRGLDIRAAMDGGAPCTVVAVSDWSTTGLGGATRADIAAQPGEPTNFNDFLRNVGRPSERAMSGGTYGFGKAAYYLASRIRTICVHTRCLVGGHMESRFMAAALGSEFEALHGNTCRRFTGRHWWGRAGADGFVDPVRGAQAEEAAAALGLSDLGGGTGTTVLIVCPDLEEMSIRGYVERAADAVLDYCWPKFIDAPEGGPSMLFHFSAEGEQVPIRHPSEIPRAAAFARAFSAARSQAPAGQSVLSLLGDIASRTPARHLGRVAIIGFTRQVDPPGSGETRSTSPLRGASHHVALVRAPGIVVRYVEGPHLPYDQAEYAGVFSADPEVDPAFARAEPPTHDDWSPDMLSVPAEKTYVRVAMRDVLGAARTFARGAPPARTLGEDVPLGELADKLGGLIASVPGPGAGTPFPAPPPAPPRPGHPPTRGPTLRVGASQVAEVRGMPVLAVSFSIDLGRAGTATVEAAAGVVVGGGSLETDPPAGAAQPAVLWWRGPQNHVIPGSSRLQVQPALAGDWVVFISIPPHTAVALDLRIAPEGGQ